MVIKDPSLVDGDPMAFITHFGDRRLFPEPLVFLLLYVLATPVLANSAEASPPCSPQLAGSEASDCGNAPAPTVTVSASTADRHYGPVDSVQSGAPIAACPGIPASFSGTVRQVNTSSEFWSVLPNLEPGDALIVSAGNRGGGWAGTIPSSASGSSGNPVYILSETIHGAELIGNSRWTVDANHIVMAGFKRSGSAVAEIQGDNVRIACNYSDMKGISAHEIGIANDAPNEYYDDIEIDNNVSINHGYTWYRNRQCSYYNQPNNSTCTGSNKRHHLHHNRVLSKPQGLSNGRPNHYLFYWGLGWLPADLNNPYYGDDVNRQEITLENNYFNWKINEKSKATEVKSSGNIIRNNCFDQMGPPSIRAGNDNLITGNWIRGRGLKREIDDHGWGNVTAFNYYSDGGSYPAAINIWRGVDWKNASTTNKGFPYTWAYASAYKNVYAHNVFNKFNGWLQYGDIDNLVAADYMFYLADQFYGKGEDNVIRDNKLYYQGTPTVYTSPDVSNNGSVTQSQFRALNPGWDVASNVHVNSELDPGVACGTPDYVNGIQGTVTTHDRIKGGAQVIRPPSWW